MNLRTAIAALALSALAATALANPREGSTFTNVLSDGYTPSSTRMVCIGTYPVTSIRVDGTLIASYDGVPASYSSISVEAPDGQHFYIQPFNTGAYTILSTPAGGYTITLPTPVASAAGAWYFEFNNWPDYYPDYSYEATWLNVSVRLGDNTFNSGGGISAYTYAEPVVAGLNTSHLRTVVAPGFSPASTGIHVTANLSQIGGGSAVALFDEGPGGGHGDIWSGDNEFTVPISALSIWPTGVYNIPITVADAQGRSSTSVFPLSVQGVTDMGSFGVSTNTTTWSTTLAAGEVRWYKFTVPEVSYTAHTFMDLWTSQGNDSTLALFNSSGQFLAMDYNYIYQQNPNLSGLSFGMGSSVRPAFHGQNSSLAAGVYYLAVLNKEGVELTGNPFGILTHGPAIGPVTLNEYLEQSVNPTITGNSTTIGNQSTALISGTFAPGAFPVNTSATVTADLAALGGQIVSLYDDGTHGDAVPHDNIFSYALIIPIGTNEGAYTFPLALTDGIHRTAAGVATLNIDLTGETIAGAKLLDSGAPITTINGALSVNDADMFRIHICDPAHFSARVTGGSIYDTQLFLFHPDGRGVATDDDSITAAAALTGPLVTSIPAGDYYLAISGYDKDPVDSAGQALWLDDPFDRAHAPDGPGAAHPIAAWDNNNSGTGTYVITLTGVSGSTCPAQPHCGSADFNCDGDLGTDSDISAFFACLSGSCPPAPCTSTADFNADGDLGTDADIEAFFRVLSGGNC